GRADRALPRGSGVGLAAALRDRAVHGRDARVRVLHSAHRGAWAAPRRRPVRARTHRAPNARARSGQRGRARAGRYAHRSLHDVLAFPARRLDRIVLGADDHVAKNVSRGTTRSASWTAAPERYSGRKQEPWRNTG